jgi:hypothetical protein
VVVGKQAATKQNSWISSYLFFFVKLPISPNFPSLQTSHLFFAGAEGAFHKTNTVQSPPLNIILMFLSS